MTEGNDQPNDLISMSRAIELTGKSRTWITNHVEKIWTIGRKDYVSESEVLSELQKDQTPKLKQ